MRRARLPGILPGDMGYFFSLLGLLVVAAVCGALGTALAGRRDRRGCFLSIATGFVGALIGTLIARWVDLPEPFPLRLAGVAFPLVWSIVGAAIFVALLNLLVGRK